MSTLRDAAREVIAEADGLGCGAMIGSDNPMEHALGVLARALSADRGEAVAYRWWRNGEPQGFWINGQPTQQQFAAAENCKDRAEWTIEYAYAASPPSPAESAEGVLGYIGAGVAVNLFTGYSVTTTITTHKAMLDDVAIYQRAAAPSQVSDADRAWRFSARELLRELTLSLSVNGARMTIDNDALRSIDQRARHLLTGQPQPGRVEGILEWAVSRWNDEVANRPLQNRHRRSLDDVWRQVIRHCGADDVVMCGPRHDDLVSQPAAGGDA